MKILLHYDPVLHTFRLRMLSFQSSHYPNSKCRLRRLVHKLELRIAPSCYTSTHMSNQRHSSTIDKLTAKHKQIHSTLALDHTANRCCTAVNERCKCSRLRPNKAKATKYASTLKRKRNVKYKATMQPCTSRKLSNVCRSTLCVFLCR